MRRLFDHDPFDKYGYFQTAGICLLIEVVALVSLLMHVTLFSLFAVIYFKILFWGALLKRWSIKELLD